MKSSMFTIVAAAVTILSIVGIILTSAKEVNGAQYFFGALGAAAVIATGVIAENNHKKRRPPCTLRDLPYGEYKVISSPIFPGAPTDVDVLKYYIVMGSDPEPRIIRTFETFNATTFTVGPGQATEVEFGEETETALADPLEV